MFYSDKHISYVEILYFEDKIYIIKIDSKSISSNENEV